MNAQVNITQAFDAERRAIRSEFAKKAEDHRKQAERLSDDDPRKTELVQEAQKIEQKLRLFDGITSALYAPNSNGIIGDVARAASPELAYQIGQHFKENKLKNEIDGGNRPEEQSANHLLAHAILGAATSYATGNDIATGAISGAANEAVAPVLSNYLYGTKETKTLSQEQKDTIVSILNLATATAIYTATDGGTTDAVSGAEVGKVGVENNHDGWLTVTPQNFGVTSYDVSLAQYCAQNRQNQACAKVNNTSFIDKYIPSFIPQNADQNLANSIANTINAGYVNSFNKKDADFLYQINTDPKLNIALDVSYLGEVKITGDKFIQRHDGREVVTIVPVKNEIWAVTGTLTLVKRRDGTYGVFDDIYDYDIKPVKGFGGTDIKTRGRNFATLTGRPACNNKSGCTSYSISFKGNINPKMIRGLQ